MLEFMVKVRAFTMNSRRLLLFVESVMVALPFTSNACTYETRDEKEERAIVDASIGDSEMHKIDRTGGAKSVVLIRGNGQVVALGNYNWDESDVYTVQFATTPNNSPNGASLPAGTVPTITYAIVRWTIDGNDMVRVISVGNGVSLAQGALDAYGNYNDFLGFEQELLHTKQEYFQFQIPEANFSISVSTVGAKNAFSEGQNSSQILTDACK